MKFLEEEGLLEHWPTDYVNVTNTKDFFNELKSKGWTKTETFYKGFMRAVPEEE